MFDYRAVWQEAEDFEFSPLSEQVNICTFAQKFSEWADDLCRAGEEPTVVSITKAKVQLLDKYYEWRSFVPKNHKDRLGNRGHICIYQVFVQTYQRLRDVELSLTPPVLFVPPQSESGGTFIGLLDEDE